MTEPNDMGAAESGAVAGAASSGGFDQIGVPAPDGTRRLLSRAQFEELPLTERVRLLAEGTLQFFRQGQEVTARDAMRE